jgi:UDP-glucuronate decarboxylase
MNILETARENQSDILLASTSEIYGNPAVHPQPETYFGNVNPTGPRSCYDEGKRCAETLMSDYARQYGTRIHIARIFNTYGPGLSMDDGRVISNFIMQALENKPITLFGNGQQTRSFCYVKDMVNGLIRLMNADVHDPVNLGNPHEISMRQLADEIIELTDSESTFHQMPLPEDDPPRRRPDISRAVDILDWQPRTSLTEGLRKTIQWFRQRIMEQGIG